MQIYFNCDIALILNISFTDLFQSLNFPIDQKRIRIRSFFFLALIDPETPNGPGLFGIRPH